ncbi:hypothetical protein LIER_36865 [Lithospermum erythrorhizon]|uniref:Uncharacterized protein n=1 Tax=Lithospermum erythrorhizon TaxID=34254 RepID=A0AAV3PCX5_LITER
MQQKENQNVEKLALLVNTQNYETHPVAFVANGAETMTQKVLVFVDQIYLGVTIVKNLATPRGFVRTSMGNPTTRFQGGTIEGTLPATTVDSRM